MNSIPRNQNKSENLILLKGQRAFYSKAKKVFYIRSIVSLLLAIVGTSIAIFKDGTPAVVIGYISLIYLFIDIFFLKKLESGLKEKGAKLQELFDVNVFELTWNEISANKKVPPEEILKAKEWYEENDKKGELPNWYAVEVGEVPQKLAILFCQRSSLMWDSRLRNTYKRILVLFILVLITVMVLVGLARDLSFAEFFLSVLIPCIPILQFCVTQITDHNECLEILNILTPLVDERIESFSEKSEFEDSTLRNFQDNIFKHRKTCPLVPDKLYWFFRNKQEQQMIFSIKNMVSTWKEKHTH